MDNNGGDPPRFDRRALLAGAAYLMLSLSKSHGTVIVDHLPWTPNAGNPPTAALPGPWMFFTGDEGRAMEALADRIILFSARPGQIKELFDVGLPRPLDAVTLRESPAYADLFSRIWHSLGEEFAKGRSE